MTNSTVLANHIRKYIPFNEEEVKILSSFLTLKKYPRQAFILNEGSVCRHRYFILSGLVRSFYFNEKEKEKITHFAIENWWLTHLESFNLETPSAISIQALEETTVLSLPKHQFAALLDRLPRLEKYFRMITENMLIAIQRRHEFFMQKSSKERYLHLIQTIPDFAQRVPQYMIASYLDITPEYLSELRKKHARS